MRAFAVTLTSTKISVRNIYCDHLNPTLSAKLQSTFRRTCAGHDLFILPSISITRVWLVTKFRIIYDGDSYCLVVAHSAYSSYTISCKCSRLYAVRSSVNAHDIRLDMNCYKWHLIKVINVHLRIHVHTLEIFLEWVWHKQGIMISAIDINGIPGAFRNPVIKTRSITIPFQIEFGMELHAINNIIAFQEQFTFSIVIIYRFHTDCIHVLNKSRDV